MKRGNILIGAVAMLLAGCGGTERVNDTKQVAEQPLIWPDYVGVTIPAGIAPLNFGMADDQAQLVDVTITGADGTQIASQGASSDIDAKQWQKLLVDNVGKSLTVNVSAKYADGWRTYQPFEIYVSSDTIDYGLTYRLIAPGYEVYSAMGIYERDLSSYDEHPILENTQVEGCMNCHSYNHCDPQYMQLHVRGPHGATLIRKGDDMHVLDTKTDSTLAACVYPYWHPDGRYVAYSTNETRQTFHTGIDKRIEVFDYASDLQVLDTETNTLLVPSLAKVDSIWETFPSFSPDGKWLYFCAAKAKGADQLKEVRYNLCRIGFDPEAGEFGDVVETLVDAEAIGKSVSFPFPSYDGRYVMYTLSDYGNFSVWHPESDLWLLDVVTGETWPLEGANSDDADSYHSWSSNSRWFVFGSRRDDGLHTRAYICHIDDKGQAAKPFLLPQQSPRQYYDDQYRSYNRPEFVKCPVRFERMRAVGMLRGDDREKLSVKTVGMHQGASSDQE